MLSASKFEIQDVSMSSAGEAQVRLQLLLVEGVEALESLIHYAFIASDRARGADCNHCHADEGFMELIDRRSRHAWQMRSDVGANKLRDGAKDSHGVRQSTGEQGKVERHESKSSDADRGFFGEAAVGLMNETVDLASRRPIILWREGEME